MGLREMSAALKARFRPVLDGDLDKELLRLKRQSEEVKRDAAAFGVSAAIVGITEGRGE